MTANAMAGDRQKVLDAGMNDHIAKPINVKDMFHTMAKWIVSSQPSAEVEAGVHKTELTIPELDGINTEAGLARTLGNSGLYLKLLRKAEESQANFIEEFDAAVAAEDWELAQRLAHTLKGVAGNIGAEQLQEACAMLENQTKQQQVGDTVHESMRAELDRVLVSLGSLNAAQETLVQMPAADAEDGTAAVEVDKQKLEDIIRQLVELIADCDTAAQELLGGEESLLLAAGLSSELKEMGQALDDYDFDTAMAVMQEIAETHGVDLGTSN